MNFSSRLLLALFCLGNVGAWCVAPAARTALPGAFAQPVQPKLTLHDESCINCHDQKAAEPKGPLGPATCLCNESSIWQKDRHRQAAQKLLAPLSQRILAAGKYRYLKACLACHATDLECNNFARFDAVAAADQPLETLKARLGEEYLKEGIGCTGCHNLRNDAGEPLKAWVAEHHGGYDREHQLRWRGLAVAEKANKGLRELAAPAARAAQCASCHVGNLAEGKFITHEMYAAGHPPLPSFELATFSAALPPHWERLQDKAKRLAKLIDEKKLPAAYQERLSEPASAQFEGSRQALVGSVVGYRVYLQSLHAASQGEPRPLDYAHFDCYACHHELRSPSWRLERGYDQRAPGRPLPRPWPRPLADLICAAQAGGDARRERDLRAEYSALDAQLKDAFNAVPFGDARRINAAAKALDDWLKARSEPPRHPPGQWQAKELDRLLAVLCAGASKGYDDFDGARQTAWTLRVLAAERPRDAKTPRLDALIAGLGPPLVLGDLRAGAGATLGPAWRERRAYDPEFFRKEMRRLADLLDAQAELDQPGGNLGGD